MRTVRQTPFIDAEVQRDPTAAGKRNGARPRPRGRRRRSRKRRGRRSSRTTRSPTSPPARSSVASTSRARPRCSSRSPSATSTRSPACGSDDRARWRRRWWSGCTRRGTSATTALRPRTGSSVTRAAVRAAPTGDRGPRGHRAGAASPTIRRRRGLTPSGVRDAGAGHVDRADQTVDQVAVLERRRRSGNAERRGRFGAAPTDCRAVDDLDRVLVRRDGD